MGQSLKVVGRGLKSGLTYDPVLNTAQIAQLTVSADREPFDGDARLFRLGVEAQRLGLAYEYDPFFSLSIARVDPLPHQLEAVYEYFLKLPRIRFLLADDPGAGKTIMAGLLLKELKARGLVRRVLIVTPASLTFQWQRELSDKFREKFDVIRGDVLRANYGQNPWQERDQVITSVSWVSIVEDARESLLRSRWDLVIVDEAHKMSAPAEDRKTYAYRLGEALSKMTDHFLLMTATPHKGDPDHFRRFLALLDPDVYGSIQSLQQALRDHEAPFYLRRTKEALVTFRTQRLEKYESSLPSEKFERLRLISMVRSSISTMSLHAMWKISRWQLPVRNLLALAQLDLRWQCFSDELLRLCTQCDVAWNVCELAGRKSSTILKHIGKIKSNENSLRISRILPKKNARPLSIALKTKFCRWIQLYCESRSVDFRS